MLTTRGMHCGMTVTADEIVAVVDRELSGRVLPISTFPLGTEPHNGIASALYSLLPLGGTAVLIDTDSDPDFLGLRNTDASTSMIDPHLLKAQTEVNVVLATHQQAIAAGVRSGGMITHHIGPHTLDHTQPFGLVQISHNGDRARIDVSVIDADGQPQAPSRDFSCDTAADAVRITDILGHNLGTLLAETSQGVRVPGVAVYVDSSLLCNELRGVLDARFGRSLLYPLRLHTDTQGLLRGALILAQKQGAAA